MCLTTYVHIIFSIIFSHQIKNETLTLCYFLVFPLVGVGSMNPYRTSLFLVQKNHAVTFFIKINLEAKIRSYFEEVNRCQSIIKNCIFTPQKN